MSYITSREADCRIHQMLLKTSGRLLLAFSPTWCEMTHTKVQELAHQLNSLGFSVEGAEDTGYILAKATNLGLIFADFREDGRVFACRGRLPHEFIPTSSDIKH